MILTPPALGAGYQAFDPWCVVTPLSCVAKAAGGAAVQAVGTSVFDAFSNWLSGGATWLVGQVFNAIVGSDAPHSQDPVSVTLTASWFVKKDSLMLAIAAVVLSPLLLAATIGAILRQDLGRLARTWLVGLPVAVVFGIGSVAVTELAVHVCDDLCHLVLGQTGPDTASFFVHLAAAPGGGAIPTVITALLSLLLLIAAVLLWLEMLMRATAIYIAAFFLPLALAGLVWPATSRMIKRLAEVLVALVFSKFVVVATLALGMGAEASSSGVGAAVTGGAIMLLAAFAPVILLRLIPVVEVAAIDHMAHMGRRSLVGAWRGANEAAAVRQSSLVSAMRERFGGVRPQGDGEPPPAGKTGMQDRKGDFFPASIRNGGGPKGPGGPSGTGDGRGPTRRPPGSGSGGGARPGGGGQSGAAASGSAAAVSSAAAGAATKVAAAGGKQAVAALPAMTLPPGREPESGDG